MSPTDAQWPHPRKLLMFRALGNLRLDPTKLILLACFAIVLWLVAVPLAALFYVSFSEDTIYGPGAFTIGNFVTAYVDSGILRLLGNSIVYALGASLLSFAIGAAVAWAVERTDLPFRSLFHALSIASFAIPALLVTMAWSLILSPNIGWANAALQSGLGLSGPPFNVYTMTGMIWVLATHNFPLAYMLMGPAFRVLDTRMEEAATISGARNYQIALRVTLPLLRPAMLSTLLLLFIRGMESFEVPRIIGMPARIDVFTTVIQEAASNVPPQFGLAGALSMTLLALCLVTIYFYRRAIVHADAYATLGGKAYSPTRMGLGAWRWPSGIAIALLFAIVLGLPLVTLLWQSFFHNVTPPSLTQLTALSLENYRYLLAYPVFREAAIDSVGLGVMGATIVVILTFVMAWYAQRATRGQAWLIDGLTFAPVAIPSVIIGAAILFAYLILPIPVYNTIWILLIAYVTLYLPYGMRFASGGLAQIHRELEEAAEISGANALQSFARVLLPLLAPMLIAAWLYVFVLVVRELAASIFLAGPQTHVLGTVALTLWEGGGSLGAVCALGVIQIIPLILIVAVMRRLETAMRLQR